MVGVLQRTGDAGADNGKWTVTQSGCDVTLTSEPDAGTYHGTVTGSAVKTHGPGGDFHGNVQGSGDIDYPGVQHCKKAGLYMLLPIIA